jgi:MoaA/NifB/PqqE/SkfB family radical SAM enzyme
MLSEINEFKPDFIVEVTMVCDLKCKNCYAPTIIPRRVGALSGAFLSVGSLVAAISEIRQSRCDQLIPKIAVRGGEPALHPDLDGILNVLRPVALNLYLETNGNWIMGGNESLLDACQRLNVIAKISFDSMHSLKVSDLSQMCDILDRRGVQWMVAITEASEAEFQATRRLCPWVASEKIVFQPKVFDQDSLIRPRLGVIHPNGRIALHLTAKDRNFASP